jgi:hypothetical protein
MAESDSTGIELSEQKHPAMSRRQTDISDATPNEKKADEHAAGKLPPEAPAPVGPFKLHVQSLKNLVSAGLDMKNKADYDALVHPLMDRCGGSIEKIASNIDAPLAGGLKDDLAGAKARLEAFGENRLPEKEMVRRMTTMAAEAAVVLFVGVVVCDCDCDCDNDDGGFPLTRFKGYFLGTVLERSRG